jgi:hypothetical protein
LFKGANWMALEPVPASAGNWTFTDNLFDGIDFQTDPAAPLDFDYNGYYPLPASQTLYNTLAYELSLTAGDTPELFSSTNDLGGLHEVVLDYALPYVGGTFGNYGYSRFFVAKTSKCGVYIEGKSGAFGMKMVACLGAALGD